MYIIKKTDKEKLCIKDAEWCKANVIKIDKINWKEFDYCPNTEARIMYNEKGIIVNMATDEKALLAVCREQNGEVADDSCMEFFLRPKESDNRYINIEINPFGTMYLGVRTSRFDPIHPEKDRFYFNIQSLVEADRWTVQYVIPFEFIDEIFGGHTKKIYANLYKCGVNTEIEHYVSAFPIKAQEPDFHRPECFGELELE